MSDFNSLLAWLVQDLDGLIKLYNDGSVVRAGAPSLTIPPLQQSYEQVLYKDVVFNEDAGLWARLYLPLHAKESKLPVLLYYHGGGFCFFSPASPGVHRLCSLWAATIGAIIVSVDYRLAPEHRLPAAYQDCIEALQWVVEAGDPWIHFHAQFCKIFLAGDSAGGNIAHQLAIWAIGASVQIKGMILVYPYFGGEERTGSETQRQSPPPLFTLRQSDALWRLALPVGSNRDHPFCNPVGAGSLLLPPMLFVIAGRDILRDKQLQYCEILKECGHQVQVLVLDDEEHGFAVIKMEDQSSLEVLRCISDFMK